MQAITRSKPKNFDLFAFLKLIRFSNLLIIVFTQYMIKIFLIDTTMHLLENLWDMKLFLLSTSTVFTAAAGYIINDYYDVKIDTVNKPERVVIGKILKRRIAMGAHIVLNVLALSIALWLSEKVFIVTFIAGFFLWLYSNQLKRLPLVGNVTVAALTSLAVIVIAVYYPKNQYLVYMFAIFAFFISLVREILKDMEDVKGDANFGCKTLPILWGIRRTKQVIYVFLGIFFTIILSTYISFPNQFALYLYATVLPPLVWLFVRLIKADTSKDFQALSTLCKIIMLLGVLSMLMI